MGVYDEKREEIVHLQGDQPDYAGTGVRGYQSTLDLGASGKHPEVRYKDFVITCDVFEYPGAPIEVVLICPRCRNTLKVSGANKRIDFDARDTRQSKGGRLSIEPFGCTWEMDPSKDGRRMEFGIGLCGWQVGISDNVALDA